MVLNTINHTLTDGTNLKFTILDTEIDGEKYYYAKLVDTDSDFYKDLSENEKGTSHGVHVTNQNQQCIYYRDYDRLVEDLLTKYEFETLKTEKYTM